MVRTRIMCFNHQPHWEWYGQINGRLSPFAHPRHPLAELPPPLRCQAQYFSTPPPPPEWWFIERNKSDNFYQQIAM